MSGKEEGGREEGKERQMEEGKTRKTKQKAIS